MSHCAIGSYTACLAYQTNLYHKSYPFMIRLASYMTTVRMIVRIVANHNKPERE